MKRGHQPALRLVPKSMLVRTGAVDHADWNFGGGLLGYVSRQRFRLAAALLPAERLRRVLEIGYGSGVFMPELATRADRVDGADVHDRAAAVTAALAGIGIVAELVQASAERLPYAGGTFDAVVVVSALEFVADVRAALREIARVLVQGGEAIVITPGDHPLLDLGLRLATGVSAQRDFGDRRAAVVAALTSEMRVVRTARFPRYGPIAIYRAYAVQPRASLPAPQER